MALRKTDNLVFFSPLAEPERRIGLRRRDDVLGALEELNLREAVEIPTSLKQKLREVGIPLRGHSISELIDLVLGSQEDYLLKERRTGRPRRGAPTERELISQILARVGH
jgi:hypothetical protein